MELRDYNVQKCTRPPVLRHPPKHLKESTVAGFLGARRVSGYDRPPSRRTHTAVELAHDGLEAIERAAQFQPNVILLDIGLPKLTGHEAAQRIREQDWGSDIVLIALTGWGQEEDKQRAMDAGCNHHLTKPAEIGTLEKLLGEITLRQAAAPATGRS